jgi:hypothetical protein
MRAAPLLFASALACGGGGAPTPVDFDAQPSLTVTTRQGRALSVFEPVGAPVARGVNALRLSFDLELPLDQVSVTVTPWMPVMGHGSAVTPTVELVDGGFDVTQLYLAMPGRWELRSRFEGGVSDDAVISFDLP